MTTENEQLPDRTHLMFDDLFEEKA